MTTSPSLLVTGAAGFVGSRFVQSHAGDALISVDATSHFRDRKELRGIEFGEIVDRNGAITWLEKARPSLSAIVHLGAITDTTEMDEEKLTTWNLEYSKALWRYATREQVPFYYASSAATYGGGENGYNDDEVKLPDLHPLNPYGVSKQRFDLWALAEERVGRRPPRWAGFKFFNVYGFGERHKHKMASVALHAFDQIRATGHARLFKSYRADIPHGLQKRDFVYVGDVVKVLDFALTSPLERGIFNLGTGEARSFLDLVRAVFRALGAPEQIDFIDMPSSLIERYQYFTQAEMGRLRAAGYGAPFASVEQGVAEYITRLLAHG